MQRAHAVVSQAVQAISRHQKDDRLSHNFRLCKLLAKASQSPNIGSSCGFRSYNGSYAFMRLAWGVGHRRRAATQEELSRHIPVRMVSPLSIARTASLP